jgi:hypothetical protein
MQHKFESPWISPFSSNFIFDIVLTYLLLLDDKNCLYLPPAFLETGLESEISGSHGGEYEDSLLGYSPI